MSSAPLRLAVDIGGTFVDAMELDTDTNEVRFQKASTTPERPWEGVLAAIEALGTDLSRADRFIHGTTLGLNAVLERRGGLTGIVTNQGLRDIFLLGRGNVPSDRMYDFTYQRPPSLVQRRHTVGVPGRLNHRGEELEPLDEDAVRAVGHYLVEEEGVASIAVCFLHSFREPRHERRAAEILRETYPGVTVSASTDIVREYREYERTSTTTLDAYIRPIFERYVERLEQGLAERGFAGRFLIMRSGGGAMTSEAAKLSPTHTVMSGPAGGIVGGSYLASELGRDDVLTFDIGGTSLDACVIESGAPAAAYEAELEHYPLLIPTYDIRTIGAGGGSIAWLDRGLLKVGPRSAGAQPGPVCYGRGGDEPTVTDAAVSLGYVDPDSFLGGDMTLKEEAAREALRDKVAAPLGLTDDEAAAGIFDVLLARTVGAVRQITVERGHDPRSFSLLAFGGAGPLLASLLAREMQIREVIVPFAPSGFSAWGMLSADVVIDLAETSMEILDEVDGSGLEERFTSLEREAAASLADQGIPAEHVVLERELELRYLGQEHALPVTVGRNLDIGAMRIAFSELHESRYGHAMDNRVQILTVRLRGIGRTERPTLPKFAAGDADPSQARRGERDAFDFGTRSRRPFAVFDRTLLEPDDVIPGPALVDEGTSTTVVHADQSLRVDEHGYLIITPEVLA